MLRAHLALPVLALALGGCASSDHRNLTVDQMRVPSAEHKLILEGVGTWEGTLTALGAGMPPGPVPAKEVVEGVGDFFTQSRFTCDFMGTPYLGLGCVGYDPARQKVVGTWFDNTSCFLAQMEGSIDVAGKSMVMFFDAPDEMTGVMTPHRIETSFAPDSYTSTFFKGEGAGTKTMVIAMKRTGSKPAH